MRFCKVAILVALIYCICFTNSALANNNQIYLSATNEPVYADQLYVSDGEGSYAGYQKLNGYPLQDKFQIYFQGDSTSFHTTFEDLRGIDPNEMIKWEYEGKAMKSTRAYLYNMFSDLTSQTNHFSGYNGKFSQEWMMKTFGKVYSDWLLGQAFSQDASRLVEKYFENKENVKPVNRFEFSNMETHM